MAKPIPPIQLVAVDQANVGRPTMDGTPTELLYDVPILLSDSDTSRKWMEMFLEKWKKNPKTILDYIANKVSVGKDRVVVHKTTIDEVSDKYLDLLLEVVDGTNVDYQAYWDEEVRKCEKIERISQERTALIRNTSSKIDHRLKLQSKYVAVQPLSSECDRKAAIDATKQRNTER